MLFKAKIEPMMTVIVSVKNKMIGVLVKICEILVCAIVSVILLYANWWIVRY